MKNLPNRFFTSIDINNHPLINSKPVLKSRYFSLLKHFATNVYNNDLTAETLDIYRKILNVQSDTYQFKSNPMSYFLAPWRKKQILILINDLYLVNAPFNVSQNDFRETFTSFARGLCTNRQYNVLCKFIERAFNLPINDKLCDYGNTLSIQVEKNRKFLGKEKTRIVFTANMSSGKSTIINAIIGKKVTRTAQEVCTGNVSYIFNKSFEDERVHLANDKITINAESDELLANDWEDEKYIASYFNLINELSNPLCLIDTPGVNSSMNRQHGRITKNTLKEQEYDIVVHVLNAQQLGTEEEVSHLRWIKNNIQNRIVIFALNKLDIFKANEDDIESSISLVKTDLEKIGFDNPIICPVSARFAFLIKQKKLGVQLSEDENDEYDFYVKKFNKPAYDLSRFYPMNSTNPNDDETIQLMKKSGFYGFEKIICGGKK